MLCVANSHRITVTWLYRSTFIWTYVVSWLKVTKWAEDEMMSSSPLDIMLTVVKYHRLSWLSSQHLRSYAVRANFVWPNPAWPADPTDWVLLRIYKYKPTGWAAQPQSVRSSTVTASQTALLSLYLYCSPLHSPHTLTRSPYNPSRKLTTYFPHHSTTVPEYHSTTAPHSAMVDYRGVWFVICAILSCLSHNWYNWQDRQHILSIPTHDNLTLVGAGWNNQDSRIRAVIGVVSGVWFEL